MWIACVCWSPDGVTSSLSALFSVIAPSPVRMLGKVPFYEMGTLYSAADLTLVPSVWYDNSPTVIYESLLGGTPVLGSAIGGIPELIREGETDISFPREIRWRLQRA